MQAYRGYQEDGFGEESSNYGGGGRDSVNRSALNNYLNSLGNDYQKGKITGRLGQDRSGPMSPLSGINSDYKSEFAGRDPYIVANAMGYKPYKISETPNLKNAELQNYLNWVPNKEKFNLANIQNGKKSNKLSPLRAGPGSVFTEDDRRSNMSKTVLKVREKFSYSQAREEAEEISIDGISISAQRPKPRALSNLRTMNGYGDGPSKKLDLSSIYIKKNSNTPGGLMSPAPKKGILDELPWEERQKVLSYSMAKINSLKRDDLLRQINLPMATPTITPQRPIRRFATEEESNIDDALRRLAKAGGEYSNLRDWSKALIRKFDKDMDGIISFQELCDGLKGMDINLALKDRVALMKKLDMNRDGEISDNELYKALSTVESVMNREVVDSALKKIVSGSSDYANLKEYTKHLIKRFDGNQDGLVSMSELSEGLRRMGISLNSREVAALMEKLDLDKNGEITQDELYKVLLGYEVIAQPRMNAASISVDQAIKKLASGAETFSSMREYVKFLIKQFDSNNDGIINFEELTTGLRSLGINLNGMEAQALMKKLDLNRDGRISEDELLKILSGQTGDIIPPALLPQVINETLKKIASGADDYSDMRGYARSLIKKFDRNQDGQIQFKELCDGLKTMNIYLTSREKEALMKKLDTNSDGNISDQEIYKALSSINIDQLKQMAKESADLALKKIAGAAEDFPNLREYVKFLMRKFDGNGDGIISFEELATGVKTLHINLTLKEKLALMKKLDLNKDGEISAEELYKTLSKVDTRMTKGEVDGSVDQVLRKIASGADDFANLKEYVRVLVTRFDKNGDGLISFEELVNGLSHFKVNLNSQERNALMKRLDFNRDGDISIDELHQALKPFDSVSQPPKYSRLASIEQRSPTISPDKVSFRQKELERITVEEIINKVKKGASKYQSFKHFVSAIMRRYDTDGDGFLNFKELSAGLNADGINLTQEEKLSLMKHLDADCDGVVSRDEIFHALLLDSRHRRNHHQPKVNVDHLLRRIRQGAEKFKSLDAFVKYLFDKLDADGSGALSFSELSNGLSEMGIEISHKEKHALMKKLDSDADGEICYEEFYKGLADAGKFKQPTELNQSQLVNIDHALKKIAIGAEQYKCLEDYIIMLFKKFDVNKDGALSFKELREGLKSMNVHLADNEIHALFHFIDVDRDGEITQEELYNAVLSKDKYTNNPRIGQQKVNVDHVLDLIKKGVEKYSSLDAYVKALMERFDINGDGSISIEELGEGLKSINVRISEKEKLALMKELDKDHDGGISQQELYNALAGPKEYKSRMNRAFSTSPTGGAKLPGFNGQALPGVDKILAQIRKAVAHYKSMQEQIIGLMRIFDLDNDGLISYLELVDGVKALGIQAKKTDMIDLFNKVDIDKDGFITQIELYKALDLRPQHSEYQGTSVSIDQVLVKLRRGSEKYHNLREYINYLFEQFASTSGAYMTFHELMNCLKTFNFNLTQVEKLALMKHIDENGDNQISKDEFYQALAQAGKSSGERHSPRPGGGSGAGYQDSDDARGDQALVKIKSGASNYKSLADYVKFLMKKFDVNKDGFLTPLELVEGLREMGIKIFKGELAAVMRRVDEDKDGFICYDELYRALNRV